MTPLKQLAAGLIGLGIAFGTYAGAAPTGDPVPGVRTIGGEDVAIPEPGPSAGAAARHAAMREKLEASREAIHKAARANLERLQAAARTQRRHVEADATASRPPDAAPQTGTTRGADTDTAAGVAPTAGPVAAVPPPTPPAPWVAPVPPQLAPSAGSKVSGNTTPVDADAPAETSAGGAESDAMRAYREAMRARFDEYMKQRQARHGEHLQRQQQQIEAQRPMKRQPPRDPATLGRFYPYPTMSAYGPRYPAAYPGYHTPYWQQR